MEAAADAIAMENEGFGIDVSIVQPAGPYPTQLQRNGLRYFEEMLARLPTGERLRLAAFETQIAAMRNELAGDESLIPQEVVDGIFGLITMAHDDRPRRLVIGPFTEAVETVNA